MRRALQLGELRAVVRLAPRLDRVLLDRLRRIRHDQIHVELDDVAEAVADGAGAERVVEREQPRLRHLVLDVAGAALEALAEPVAAIAVVPAPDPAVSVSSIAKPAPPPSVYAVSIESVSRARRSPSTFRRSTMTWSSWRSLSDGGIDLLERDRLAVDVQPPEAFAAQRRERLGDRIHQARQRRLRASSSSASPSASRLRRLVGVLLELPLGRQRRGRHDRHVEADEQPRARRQAARAARPRPRPSRARRRVRSCGRYVRPTRAKSRRR